MIKFVIVGQFCPEKESPAKEFLKFEFLAQSNSEAERVLAHIEGMTAGYDIVPLPNTGFEFLLFQER